MTEPGAETDEGDLPLDRVSSFVPGLDAVLCGGFLQGGLYLIQGVPGMGKTILGSQMLYGHAAAGHRTLFVTVLGESHGRMMVHLRSMQFFDPTLIPEYVEYLSAYQALDDGGLKALSHFLLREVQTRRVSLLVIDGMSAVEAKAESELEIKRFTHELQVLASAVDCTTLLLTTTTGASRAPEHTMVDGVIELRQRICGVRTERRLLVHKLRGSAFLEGEHTFRITRAGVTVFPRIEAVLAMPTRRDQLIGGRMSSGITSLDPMLGGGLPVSSVTAVVGPSGAGKTTLGLQFLAGSSAAEPGLLFGCYEPPERLRFKAATMGIDFAGMQSRGEVDLIWHPIGEHMLDELAGQLLDAVRQRGVKRLVIDGISGFQQAALEPDRTIRFWSVLSNELRALGVTTVNTLEMPELIGPEVRVPVSGMPSLAEVMVLMRYVELRSRLFRLISLIKVRDGAFDPTIREFAITDTGIVVGQPFAGVEAILSGMGREATRSGGSGAVDAEGGDQGPFSDGTR